ncbi:ABC transporter permease [Inquilinus limosus]|uniref:ABC transporter permease n=1 Tax=Inquilinus limosus MP06 TaxID=1398085 RepID=A0A0A0D342_9PROT|nr:ABC transporter permease [Inquilinus limosus]KGM32484.1 ABC transporter permease [Inquilinus limosus MP06]
MRLEPRERASPLLMLGASAGAALLALLLCAIPLLWAGAPVLQAYGVMIQGAFGSRFAIAETLSRATPLVLTGLAATVAFRAKLWNIGAEGQLYLGALAATALGSGALDWPAWALLPLILLAGAAAGGLWMAGPTLLKTRLGVDEVVTTLLLNFVVLLFISMMLEGPMKDPMSMGWPQSAPVLDAATLPKLIPRTRVHAGLVVAVVAAVLVWLMTTRTTWGFEMRATGANPSAARFAGMPVGRVMLRVGLISGALAGLAGVGEVAGLKGYLSQDLSPGYGYAGIVVAMLSQLHALGVLLAALFVAAVFVGADSMSRAIGVSSYIANLVVATSLLTVLLSGIVLRYRVRWR